MDKAQIKTILFKNIELSIKRKLNTNESNFLNNKINSIDFLAFKNVNMNVFLKELITLLLGNLRKFNANASTSLDLHEIQRGILSNDSEYSSMPYQIKPEETVNTLLSKPNVLQSIFNPEALLSSTYLILDRKFQASDSENITEFKWNISDVASSSNMQNTALTSSKINNISSITIMPFKLHTVDYMFNSRNRLSIEMIELNKQAYISNLGSKRYHFILDIKPDTSGYSNTIDDLANCCTTFKFAECINDLTSITLTFGNPESNLTLDLDKLPGAVSIVGLTSVLTFGKLHKCHIGEIVQITACSSSEEVLDRGLINLINRQQGHIITATSDLTITIDLDLSGLIGVLNNSLTSVYLDSKRFVINMEISYYKK